MRARYPSRCSHALQRRFPKVRFASGAVLDDSLQLQDTDDSFSWYLVSSVVWKPTRFTDVYGLLCSPPSLSWGGLYVRHVAPARLCRVRKCKVQRQMETSLQHRDMSSQQKAWVSCFGPYMWRPSIDRNTKSAAGHSIDMAISCRRCYTCQPCDALVTQTSAEPQHDAIFLCTWAVLAVMPRQMHMTSSTQNGLQASVHIHQVTALSREEAALDD
ncbi:unnamed protein product [Symbiodinium necroappetens]|uniref:Uncharacterized protein n=1 Tax=Symbiodinium necroappetens TaxID=1628268 RepID=A0A812S8U1_9DINO|nr:unnamed protein product [Symbiodinium necroappetens]